MHGPDSSLQDYYRPSPVAADLEAGQAVLEQASPFSFFELEQASPTLSFQLEQASLLLSFQLEGAMLAP
jgi:hypothetical protein